MKILCISDKGGRVQYERMKFLSKYFGEHDFRLRSLEEEFSTKRHDLVYYTSFSLLRKKGTKGKKIASVTSHKCLDDLRYSLMELNKLDGVSVNNTILFKAFKPYIKNLYYTPNGVDTNLFNPKDKWKKNRIPVLGWVGNRDREVKNYRSILKPLISRVTGVKFDVISPSKKDPPHKLKSSMEMRDYYRRLDYFLVTSSAEGTPNPALEAMACGVPVITTKVGNMIEIVTDSANGFFANDNVKSFADTINRAISIPPREYRKMRRRTIDNIQEWDWDIKSKAWVQFFEDFI